MQIYIYKNNDQFGPFDNAQIEDYIKTNAIAMEDLAWAEGEPEWIPLSDLLLKQTNIQDVEGIVIPPSPVEIEAPKVAEAKILTKNIAKQFLKENNSIHLYEFTEIEHAAARALAKHKGDLNLNGLRSLTDESAMALAQHQGMLYLANLASLSNTGAEALVQSKWSDNWTTLVASKNVELTLEKAKARVKAKLQAQTQARAQAEAKAQAQAKLQLAQVDNRSEAIKNASFVLFFIVTPIIGVILLFIGFRDVESDSALNLILTGFFCIGLPFFGILLIGALHGDSNPQQRNAQIAMIQRQQMINKLDDIKNENNDY